MKREEAIKIIDCYDIGFYDLSGEKIPADKLAEAFDMAIEALSVAVSREDTVTLNSPISIQAEMVAVVRCKDCKHYGVMKFEGDECHFCRELEYTTREPHDFCSWGEREGGAE